jgi:peptidoglycan/LPS O-acetylase OafA/YrhL
LPDGDARSIRLYRPEIDGLRGLAVLVVLLNHLNPSLLPGGYLGVDLFFVISGYVVTASLVGHPARGIRQFLLDFYTRRFRRLYPALITCVLVTAVLFSALVHPGEGVFAPILRTGITALFGVSNVYLLRQGGGYFQSDVRFNPFVHTWSLGVEEQFYLVWPFVLVLCGFARRSCPPDRRRLAWISIGLSISSLAVLALLQARGQGEAAFYLMPARFWELAAGTLAWLLRPLPQPGSGLDPGSGPGLWGRACRRLSLPALALLIAVMVTPPELRLPATAACVAASVILLIGLEARRGPGGWLSHSLCLWLGVRSYSLYLWHWPVIVLARWSLGLNRVTVLPTLLVILALTLLSYRLESHFRHPAARADGPRLRALFGYPLLSLIACLGIGLLQGPARGALFLGDRSRAGLDFANGHAIPGTAFSTANCFQEPTAPVAVSAPDRRCLAQPHAAQPTLYFEGDSHTEMLMPLGAALLSQGHRNVSVQSRGSCPFPWFSPWANGADRIAARQGCARHSRRREQWLLQHVRPGDVVVVSVKLPAYTISDGGARQRAAQAASAQALRSLARGLQARGAEEIVFGPLPFFPQRPKSQVPASLCLVEWYRPASALDPACRPQRVNRESLVRSHALLNRTLTALEAELPNLHVFRTFPIVCPPEARQCSTHQGARMVMVDSNHLSAEGVRLLEQPFLRLLSGLRAPQPLS